MFLLKTHLTPFFAMTGTPYTDNLGKISLWCPPKARSSMIVGFTSRSGWVCFSFSALGWRLSKCTEDGYLPAASIKYSLNYAVSRQLLRTPAPNHLQEDSSLAVLVNSLPSGSLRTAPSSPCKSSYPSTSEKIRTDSYITRTIDTSRNGSVDTYILSPSLSDPKEIPLSPIKECKPHAGFEASPFNPVDFDEKASQSPLYKAKKLPYVASFISAFRTPESSRQMAKRKKDSSV